jgi:hypothetical protein
MIHTVFEPWTRTKAKPSIGIGDHSGTDLNSTTILRFDDEYKTCHLFFSRKLSNEQDTIRHDLTDLDHIGGVWHLL